MTTRNPSLLLIVILATLVSCSDPTGPVLPSWDVRTNVPLVSVDQTIERLIQQGGSFEIDERGDNTLVIQRNFPLRQISVGDSLRLGEVRFAFSKSLGLLLYDIPNIFNKDVALGSAFPGLTNGTYVVPPLDNANLVDVTVDLRQYFQSVRFADGRIILAAKNNFPVPVTMTQPLRIMDIDGNVLKSVSMPMRIEVGEQKDLTPISLAGLTLPGMLKISFPFSTPGSNGEPVAVDRGQSMSLQASIVGTKIDEVVANVPTQEASYEEFASINDAGIKLVIGHVKSGTLDIDITNHVPVGATIDVRVDGVQRNGEKVERSVTIQPRAKTFISIPLAGYELTPIDQTKLKYTVHVKTLVPGSTVTLRSSDSIAVVATLKNVTFKSLRGLLEARSMIVDQMQSFDASTIANFTGSFQFTGARMWLDVSNGVALPVQFSGGNVTGINSQTSRQAKVSVPQTFIAAKSKTRLAFSDQEVLTFLNTFGSQFPNKFLVQGSMIVNPENRYGEVSDADSLSTTLGLELPLRFALKDGAFTDTTAFTLDAETKQRIGQMRTGKLYFLCENGLPVGVTVRPEIVDANGSVLFTPPAESPITVVAGTTNEQGFVVGTTKNEVSLVLGQADFAKLKNAAALRYTILFNTQGSAAVTIRTTDFIRVRSYATFDINTGITGR